MSKPRGRAEARRILLHGFHWIGAISGNEPKRPYGLPLKVDVHTHSDKGWQNDAFIMEQAADVEAENDKRSTHTERCGGDVDGIC